jgi:hypothetical protein
MKQDMKTQTTLDIDAVIKLLDDPNEEIYSVVSMKLFDEGIETIKSIEKIWGNCQDPVISKRVFEITQRINHKYVVEEMRKWAYEGKHDLLKGAFWLARYQYPETDFTDSEATIATMINDARSVMLSENTPLEKIAILNHVFFQTHGISRTFSTVNNPENFFINNVIHSRKGNFFSLGLLYGGIGQRLGLPLLPLNLPDNFALAYLDPELSHLPINENSALFYINPANKGAIFGKAEINDFLTRLSIKPDYLHYRPMHNIDAIILLFDYLILSFNKLGNKIKAHELRILQNCIRNG